MASFQQLAAATTDTAPVLALLCLWGTGRRFDCDLIFFGLLWGFSRWISPLLDMAPSTEVMVDESAVYGALAVSAVLVLVLPLVVAGKRAFSRLVVVVLVLHSAAWLAAAGYAHLVWPWLFLLAACSPDAFRFLLAVVACGGDTSLRSSGAITQAAVFLVVGHGVVSSSSALQRMVYVVWLACLLSLSGIVLCDALLLGGGTGQWVPIVACFQLNLARRGRSSRRRNSAAWKTQLQHVAGVGLGAFAALRLVRGTEAALSAAALVALTSLVFLSPHTIDDFGEELVVVLAPVAVAAPLLSKLPTSTSTSSPHAPVELSAQAKAVVPELLAQYSQLQHALAQLERTSAPPSTTARLLVQESNTMAQMIPVCEDMVRALQAALAQAQQEERVFARAQAAELAGQAQARARALQHDLAVLGDMLHHKLRPKFQRKNEDAMAVLLKRGENGDGKEEEEEHDMMMELVRKRLKPAKQPPSAPSLTPTAAATVAVAASTPLRAATGSFHSPAAPSSTTATTPSSSSFLPKLLLRRRSQSFNNNNNEASMRSESSAGLSTASSSQRKRRSLFTSLFGRGGGGRKREEETAAAAAASMQ